MLYKNIVIVKKNIVFVKKIFLLTLSIHKC
jgi:hypothetical protein